MYILWIYEGHDASVCIIKDWKIKINIEKERLSRNKHDRWNIVECIQYCIDWLWISINDISFIATSKTIRDKSKRSIKIIEWTEYENFCSPYYSKHTFSLLWKKIPWFSIDHHISHASSAYYLSWFNDCWILAIDWWWDFTATMILKWKENKITPIESFNTNIWRVWSECCASVWLKRFWEAWTLMALWTLWEPIYKNSFYKLFWDIENFRIDYNEDINKILNKYYHWDYVKMRYKPQIYNFEKQTEKFYWIDHFSFINKMNHLDKTTVNFATSLQSVTNEIIQYYIDKTLSLSNSKYMCYSWWIALNCVTNSLIRKNIWKNLFIPPFCNDSWLSIWNALYTYYHILDNSYFPDKIENCYFWKIYNNNEIVEALNTERVSKYLNYKLLSEKELLNTVTDLLVKWKIIWWFQWWSESWPRALWNRSIICNPWFKDMKDILNNKVKHRESYRPFAPSVLLDESDKRFDIKWESPFMLYTFNVKKEKRKIISAIVHIDWSARVQTVSKRNNKLYYKLIQTFYKKTWIPILLDTSFNDREPMVETPFDAIQTYLTTNIDVCVIWNYLITKISNNE